VWVCCKCTNHQRRLRRSQPPQCHSNYKAYSKRWICQNHLVVEKDSDSVLWRQGARYIWIYRRITVRVSSRMQQTNAHRLVVLPVETQATQLRNSVKANLRCTYRLKPIASRVVDVRAQGYFGEDLPLLAVNIFDRAKSCLNSISLDNVIRKVIVGKLQKMVYRLFLGGVVLQVFVVGVESSLFSFGTANRQRAGAEATSESGHGEGSPKV
jgi:hypothetical protein